MTRKDSLMVLPVPSKKFMAPKITTSKVLTNGTFLTFALYCTNFILFICYFWEIILDDWLPPSTDNICSMIILSNIISRNLEMIFDKMDDVVMRCSENIILHITIQIIL